MKNQVVYINKKPIIRTMINGSEVFVKFADAPQPKVKDNIIEILTACYEGKVQDALGGISKRETA